MARYRTKDDVDLAWNRIRRRVTAEITIETQNVREEILNVALGKAWGDFAEALGEGKVPEVEGRYSDLVSSILKDSVPKIMEASEVRSDEVD